MKPILDRPEIVGIKIRSIHYFQNIKGCIKVHSSKGCRFDVELMSVEIAYVPGSRMIHLKEGSGVLFPASIKKGGGFLCERIDCSVALLLWSVF